jgi:hypothetical protein
VHHACVFVDASDSDDDWGKKSPSVPTDGIHDEGIQFAILTAKWVIDSRTHFLMIAFFSLAAQTELNTERKTRTVVLKELKR